MRFALLSISGGLFMLFGFVYLLAPDAFSGAAGLSASASGLTDIRATYGGFQLGFGAFLIWCLSSPERELAGLLALALVVGGLGSCRLVGLLLDGSPNSFHIGALAFEIPLTLLALFAWSRGRVAGQAAGGAG